jgi:hypothetical protein
MELRAFDGCGFAAAHSGDRLRVIAGMGEAVVPRIAHRFRRDPW